MLRELSQDGVNAYEAGDYPRALEKLEKAYAILPTAPLGLWSGRALEKSGQLVEAAERFLAASRAPLDPGGEAKPQEVAKGEAQSEHAALEPRIPRLTVTLSGTDGESVELLINGKPVLAAFLGQPMPVNPGQVEITLRGTERDVVRHVLLQEGAREAIEIDWNAQDGATTAAVASSSTAAGPPAQDSAAPDTRRSWQPTVGWIAVGVGAAGLALGGVTGAMAADLHSSLGCNATGCPPSTTEGEREQGNTLRLLSTTGFIAGGVLVAAGVTLLFTAPKRDPKAAYVAPMVGLGSLGLPGTF